MLEVPKPTLITIHVSMTRTLIRGFLFYSMVAGSVSRYHQATFWATKSGLPFLGQLCHFLRYLTLGYGVNNGNPGIVAQNVAWRYLLQMPGTCQWYEISEGYLFGTFVTCAFRLKGTCRGVIDPAIPLKPSSRGKLLTRPLYTPLEVKKIPSFW